MNSGKYMYGHCHDEVVWVYWEIDFCSFKEMVISVLQFGWKSKQAIIVSVISIAINVSNLFAVIEFDT